MISIITPVYNGERFIESCIQVVIDQACPESEHIIVDGGSTDSTVNIIKQHAQKYSHIRWISEKDNGQSDAMNKGIAMAKGKILGILNVDDFYQKNVLNRVIKIFDTLPENSLVVGNCNVWDDGGNLLYVSKPARLSLLDILLDINQFPFNPSAYFYHLSLHEQIGLYDVAEHYVMDLDFIMKALQFAKIKYINETWGNFRLIENTKTFKGKETGQMDEHVTRVLTNYKNQLTPVQIIQLYNMRVMRSVKKAVVQFKNTFLYKN